MRLEVRKGNIVTETVRGIVNTTNKDLSLKGGEQHCLRRQPCSASECVILHVTVVTSGFIWRPFLYLSRVSGVSGAILKAAGQSVEDECKKLSESALYGMECFDLTAKAAVSPACVCTQVPWMMTGSPLLVVEPFNVISSSTCWGLTHVLR